MPSDAERSTVTSQYEDVARIARSSCSGDIPQIVDFLLRVDSLKEVTRQNPIATGIRRERTAEHSWHVSIACLLFIQYATEPVDVHRAMALAVVHDMPEILVGDTFVYGPGEAGRRMKEVSAVKTIASYLPHEEGVTIEEAWRDYEFCRTAEGRYVMALDILMPIFLNFAAGRCSSWAAHHVRASAVKSRVKSIRAYIPVLADLAEALIQEASTRGFLIADYS